jgi:hypothetical protein
MKTLVLVTALAMIPALAYASAPSAQPPASCGSQGAQCQMATAAGSSHCSPVQASTQPDRSDRMFNGRH